MWNRGAAELFEAEDCTRTLSPEGVCACCSPWSLAQIEALFRTGHPDNALSSVGLTIHGFDGTMRGGGAPPLSMLSGAAYETRGALPWLPCDSGWCKNTSRWLSTSVISMDHHSGFSDSGLVLKPGANKVRRAPRIRSLALWRSLPAPNACGPTCATPGPAA